MPAPPVKRAIDEDLPRIIAEEETDIDDSHPPLRERVAALGEMPQELDAGGTRATSLLHDLERLETELIVAMAADPAAARSLNPVVWEETATRVYLPAWKHNAEQHAETLRGTTALQVPDVMIKIRENGAGIVASALAAKLHDDGWLCDAMPGTAVAFTRDGRTFEPFNAVSKLVAGDLNAAQWEEACRGAGIETLPLV